MRHGLYGALTLLVCFGGGALAQQSNPDANPYRVEEAPSASASASAPAKPSRPMAGYSYGGPKKEKEPVAPAPTAGQPARQRRVVVQKAGPSGPIATLPGFEMLGDGSSRVFVQLTQTVPVEERKAKGSLTYVLKGAHVSVHNNTNPLVTVHFNTPVSEARLRPAGADLLLVIDLRAPSSPTWKLTPAKDGASILQIDFPKGSFVPAKDSSG